MTGLRPLQLQPRGSSTARAALAVFQKARCTAAYMFQHFGLLFEFARIAFQLGNDRLVASCAGKLPAALSPGAPRPCSCFSEIVYRGRSCKLAPFVGENRGV